MAVPVAVGAAKMVSSAAGQVGIQLVLENAFFNKDVEKSTKKTESAFSKSFNNVKKFAKNAFNDIKNTITNSLNVASNILKNGFSNVLNRVKNKFQETFNRIGTIMKVSLVAGSAYIIKFGKDAVQAASDTQAAWTGLYSIVEGTGKSFSEAQGFLKEYVSDGLVPLTDAVTAYKTLAARGYDVEQIEGIMLRLKDAAAFNRQSSYSYGEAIKSAAEGLKNENSILVDNAGITKNVAKMWEEYAEEIGTTANNLTLAQKRQAEYNGIMKETTFQLGDAKTYADTYAGQIAKLSTAFYNLKTAVGSVVAPVLQSLLPAITTAVNGLTKLFNKLQQIMSVFGYEWKEYYTKSASTAIDSATESASGLSDGLDSTGTAAQKAAKKIKKAFAGIDEINVLNTSDSSSGSSGSSGSDGSSGSGGNSNNTTEGTDKIGEWTKKEQEWLERSVYDWGVAFGEAINKGLEKIPWDTIQTKVVGVATKIAEFLNGAVKGLDWHLLGTTFGEGFNTIIYGLNTFFKVFDWDSLGVGLGEGINGIFDSVDWKTLGEYLGRKFSSTFQILSNMFETIDWLSIGTSLAKSFQNMIDNIDWEAIGDTFSKGINGITRSLFSFAIHIDWIGLGETIYKELDRTIKNIDWQGLGITLGTLWTSIFDVLAETLGKKELWTNLGDKVVTSINSLIATIDWEKTGTTVSNFVTGITGFIVDLLKNVDWEKAFDDFLDGVDLAQILVDILEIKFELKKMKWQAIAKIIVDGIWDGIKLYFKNATTKIGDFVDEYFIKPMEEVFNSEDDNIFELGYNIIAGLFKGFAGFLKAPAELAKAFIFDPIIGGIKSVFGIASPAKEMEPIGEYIIEGLWEGIKGMEQWFKDKWEIVKGWFSEITVKVKGVFEATKEWVEEKKNNVITWWGDVKTAVKSKYETTKSNVQGWWNDTKAWFSSTTDKAKTKVASVYTTTKSNVKGWWSNVKSWWNDSKNGGEKKTKVGSTNTTTKKQTSGWWTTIKGWWSSKKLSIGSTNNTTKKQVSNWWNSIKSWWGSKTLSIKANVAEATGSVKGFANDVISKINSKLPNWLPKIPKLAQGGWLKANNPQLAIVGDNKHEPEIVAPESKIREQVSKALEETGTNTTQQIEFVINVKYEDGRSIIKKINNTQIQDGKISLLV